MEDYLQKILRARVYDVAVETPLELAKNLSNRYENQIWLKREDLQPVFSFKLRGAYNRMVQLHKDELRKGVVASSAGNHAQGVALRAAYLICRAVIVMPVTTPATKVNAVHRYKAEVVLHGETYDESYKEALRISRDEGLTFIHPFNDEHVIAGQGTIVLEMLGDVPELDIIIVPVGGGGLIAGCAVAAKSTRPAMEVFGVETESYPSLTNALTGGSRPCSGSTLAEGIAVAEIGNIPFPLIKENVDKVLTVSESAIESAVAMFALHDKVVAEGAGAAGLAAILEYPQYFSEKKVGLILCGGNIDSRMLSSVLMRNMVRYGQVVTLSIAMPDKPGQLHTVSGICAEAGANVLAVEHSRFAMDLAASSARLDITIETKDQEHAEEVIQNIKSEGFLVSVKELTK